MDRPIHLNQAGHPPDASRDQQHLAPPPVSSASAVSNIGRFEAAGGVGAREEQHRPLKQPQPWSASPRERLHEAGAEAHSQTLQQPRQAQAQMEPQHPQMELQRHESEQDPQQQAEGALREVDLALEQRNQPPGQQQPQLQHQHQHLKQPWQPQGQPEVAKQRRQQQSQQPQQPQTQTRAEADRWRASLLTGYVPPAAYTHVNVPVLIQQTSAAIIRWGDLQKTLDVASDSATVNLSAQAQVRASLKRDLTNLTQLADAQTKHIQRTKMRQMQEMQQSAKAPAQGAFPGGVTATPSSLAGGTTPTGSVGLTREGYSYPSKPQSELNPPSVPVASMRGAQMSPPSHAPNAPIGAVLMQHGAGGAGAGVTHGSLAAARPDPPAEEQRADWRQSEWPSGTSSPRPPVQSTSAPPTVPPQHAMPLQHRLHDVKQQLDRTEPRNKWVVLLHAALQLPPNESHTYEQFFRTIQGLLKTYNGAVGAEVAQALRTCLDPRVFDPMDIKRSQDRMADVYYQWARHGQR